MTITNSDAVLILGAGVSVPFGMPLGGELMSRIENQISHEHRKLDPAANNFDRSYALYLNSALNDNKIAFDIPIHSAMLSKYGKSGFAKAKKDLEIVQTRLKNQTCETIDDFIVENPSFSEITKLCIASILLLSCYHNTSHFGGKVSRVDFAARKASALKGLNKVHERNWIHLLINLIRQGIRHGHVNSNNKVKIVTFNYDMIFEYVLDKQFSNTEHMEDKNWQDYIEILHPHGKCTGFPSYESNLVEKVVAWADSIFVVQENNLGLADEVFIDREKANKWVLNSSEIYAVGFSFAGPNCRMLGLEKNDLSKEIQFNRKLDFCNYDGNLGLSRSVNLLNNLEEKLDGKFIVEEQSGTVERPLSVVDWIKMGVLGELPG